MMAQNTVRLFLEGIRLPEAQRKLVRPELSLAKYAVILYTDSPKTKQLADIVKVNLGFLFEPICNGNDPAGVCHVKSLFVVQNSFQLSPHLDALEWSYSRYLYPMAQKKIRQMS